MSEMRERVAGAIEATMFAPHELPLSDELHAKYLETACAAIDAHKAALAEAGFVIVPREPTRAMSDAAFQIEAAGHSQRTLIEAGWRVMNDAALVSERGAEE